MVVEKLSLTELLLTRQWLIMVGNSRDSCGMKKEQAAKVSLRIREVDAELTRRVIDGDFSVIWFNDPDFENTLQELRENREMSEGDSDDGT